MYKSINHVTQILGKGLNISDRVCTNYKQLKVKVFEVKTLERKRATYLFAVKQVTYLLTVTHHMA